MIYVTHDQVEAMTMGTASVSSTWERSFRSAHPLKVYPPARKHLVAAFLGSPPMNLLSAKLEKGAEGRRQLRLGDQAIEIPVAGI